MDRHLRAVLFDWDGTLVDSAAATYLCYRQLFESYGLQFDRQRFQETYAPDWHQTYRMVGLPESVWQEADLRWLTLYEQQPRRAVDGAGEALALLRTGGLIQGVVTSGDRHRVERETGALGFEGYFSVLVCSGEAPRPKPAPDPLLAAIERLGLTADAVAYVGDSPEDMQMARASGALAIAVPGAFPNRHLLAAALPHHIADSIRAAARFLLQAPRET